MVAVLLFFPWRPSRKVASPFSSVMMCMSAPVFVISPLLSHRDQKGARAGHLSKVVPITWCFSHYMVSVLDAVKAEIVKGGSGKTDYRNRARSGGGSTVNRGHEHHRSIRRCRICEGRPRRFGGVQRGGGTWNANSSRTVQQWSVIPAAMAGVLLVAAMPVAWAAR